MEEKNSVKRDMNLRLEHHLHERVKDAATILGLNNSKDDLDEKCTLLREQLQTNTSILSKTQSDFDQVCRELRALKEAHAVVTENLTNTRTVYRTTCDQLAYQDRMLIYYMNQDRSERNKELVNYQEKIKEIHEEYQKRDEDRKTISENAEKVHRKDSNIVLQQHQEDIKTMYDNFLKRLNNVRGSMRGTVDEL
jgi:hypothetical protein